MQTTRKRCLALLLCLFTLLSCAPMYASAADAEEIPAEVQTEVSDDQSTISEDAKAEEPALEVSTEPVPAQESEPEVEAEPDMITETEPKTEAEAETETETELESNPSEEAGVDEPVEEAPLAPMQKAVLKAASSSSFTFKSLLTGSQMSSANNYLNYTGGSGTKAVPVHQVVTGGATYWGYCADMRNDWPGSDYTDYTKKALPGSDLYQVQKVVMQLGFGDNNLSRLKTMFGYDLNNYQAYQATQVVLWASTVWEEQWHYINPAPSTIRKGVTDYWQVKAASGKDKNAYNFALALADAVQAVYEKGIGCDISIVENGSTTTAQRFKITVKPKNYYGGYTAAISGIPSGATLSSTDTQVTVQDSKNFSSTATSGTDSLIITIPKASSEKSYTIKVTVTPTIRVYKSNSAVAFLEAGSSSYQDILYSAGTQSVSTVSNSATVSVTDLPKGKITITKLDSKSKKAVPNVTFELYKYDGSKYVATGTTAASNSKGVAEFTNLTYDDTSLGRYRVYEKASDTHDIWTNHYVCWVNVASGLWYSYESATAEQKTGYATENSTGSYDFTFGFTAYNDETVKNGSLTILKKDGAKPLTNVSFVLTDNKGNVQKVSKGSDGAYLPNASGGQTMVTDKNGKIVLKELPFGTYLVTEVATANGSYTLLPTSFTVTLPVKDKTGNDQLDLTYTVLNNSTFTLPKTGGSGTFPTPFMGMLLIASMLTLIIITLNKGENSVYEEKTHYSLSVPVHSVSAHISDGICTGLRSEPLRCGH